MSLQSVLRAFVRMQILRLNNVVSLGIWLARGPCVRFACQAILAFINKQMGCHTKKMLLLLDDVEFCRQKAFSLLIQGPNRHFRMHAISDTRDGCSIDAIVRLSGSGARQGQVING
jgi:hypothetical protein